MSDPRDFEYSRGLEYTLPLGSDDELSPALKKAIDEVIFGEDHAISSTDIDGIV